MKTNEELAMDIARKCASKLAMDSSHIPAITGVLVADLPLVKFIAVSMAADKYMAIDPMVPGGIVDISFADELLRKELKSLREAVPELWP